MTVQRRDMKTLAAASGNSRTIDNPSTEADDFVYLHVSVSSGSATITPPAGFSLVESVTGANGIYVYHHINDGSEPSTYTVTFTGTPTTTLDILAFYSDTGQALGTDAHNWQINDPASTAVNFPSINTIHDWCMLLCFATLPGNTDSLPPTDMLEIYDHGAGPRNYLSYDRLPFPTASGVRSQTPAASTLSKIVVLALAEAVTPTGLAATPIDDHRIDLAWDDVAYEDNFQLERSPDGVSDWEIIQTPSANDTAYSDIDSLSAATTYYYRIKALASTGDSNYSATVTSATLSTLLPPADLTLTILSAYRARLDWTDTNDREDGYAIERSTSALSGFVEVARVAADVEAWTNYALRPQTHYYWRVRAFVS